MGSLHLEDRLSPNKDIDLICLLKLSSLDPVASLPFRCCSRLEYFELNRHGDIGWNSSSLFALYNFLTAGMSLSLSAGDKYRISGREGRSDPLATDRCVPIP